MILDLVRQPQLGRDSYCVSPANAKALATLDAWPNWPDRVLLLAGPEGSGKSHLARIWAERVQARYQSAQGLELVDLPVLARGAIIVQDADQGMGDEAHLFHLLNLLRESGGWLLLTARQRPDHWGLRLRDLLSRLRLAPCVDLAAPDDALVRMVFAKHLADRQLVVEPAVFDFVVMRMERSFAAASAMAAALDGEALARSQAVTRPLAAEVLARLNNGQQEIDFD